jgi:hypothetical protein
VEAAPNASRYFDGGRRAGAAINLLEFATCRCYISAHGDELRMDAAN